jgi:bifunctional UDP-N-acetylglucosamine pyrophosphorylase/glucosamine-1-phosphate N-acetyltransferase
VNGVTFIDAEHTYIEANVKIGQDTIVYPGTVLRGNTSVGSDCVIGPSAELTDTTVGDGSTIRQSVAEGAEVGEDCSVGPFAYLRPGTKLGRHVKVGDFVEIKNTVIGEHSKVPHLSYVGDAIVGSNVNIGCGAITANYDGYNKSKTEIGDNVFIGSNANLIAPVKIGSGAYVVAGSTITQNVPDNDVAIARERQVNKPGYADKIRARARAKKDRETE